MVLFLGFCSVVLPESKTTLSNLNGSYEAKVGPCIVAKVLTHVLLMNNFSSTKEFLEVKKSCGQVFVAIQIEVPDSPFGTEKAAQSGVSKNTTLGNKQIRSYAQTKQRFITNHSVASICTSHIKSTNCDYKLSHRSIQHKQEIITQVQSNPAKSRSTRQLSVAFQPEELDR